MTKAQAIQRAKNMARRSGEWTFVVFEDSYHAVSDEETDTFFFGAPVICAVSPSGQID